MMASVVEALHCAGGAAASSTLGDGSDCGTDAKASKRRGFEVGRGGGTDCLAGGGALGIAGTDRGNAAVRGGLASNGAKPCTAFGSAV